MAITDARAMTIGAIPDRTGVNVETIRYYERIGVLPRAPPRSSGGRRVYAERHEVRLIFVRRCRELGFSLEQVRELLALGGGDNDNCGEVHVVASTHLGTVRDKIADLRRMELVLSVMVDACAGGTLAHCPIIETLSLR